METGRTTEGPALEEAPGVGPDLAGEDIEDCIGIESKGTKVSTTGGSVTCCSGLNSYVGVPVPTSVLPNS